MSLGSYKSQPGPGQTFELLRCFLQQDTGFLSHLCTFIVRFSLLFYYIINIFLYRTIFGLIRNLLLLQQSAALRLTDPFTNYQILII